MQETVGRIASLEQRVGTMDMELKEHFLEMRTFTSEALAGVESRLGARIDGVENKLGARIDGLENKLDARIDGVEKGLGARIDRFERDVKAGFQVVDGRLGRVERRLDQMDLKLDLLIRRLPRPARQTGSKRPRSRKASR